MPYIKLSIIVKERPLDILLNYKRPQTSIFVSLLFFKSQSYIFKIIANCDPIPSITILSWLQNPDVLEYPFFLLFLKVLKLILKVNPLLVLNASGNMES